MYIEKGIKNTEEKTIEKLKNWQVVPWQREPIYFTQNEICQPIIYSRETKDKYVVLVFMADYLPHSTDIELQGRDLILNGKRFGQRSHPRIDKFLYSLEFPGSINGYNTVIKYNNAIILINVPKINQENNYE